MPCLINGLSLHKQPFVTTHFQFITAHFVRHHALKMPCRQVTSTRCYQQKVVRSITWPVPTRCVKIK